MKEITEQEAYLRLSAFCAQAEHCRYEMLDKMRRWGLDEAAAERVATRLVSERYVDDERYARAFVRDKVRYQKWGRRKIEQGLWQKHIADDTRQRVLDEVDNEEYLNVLRPLLKQKRKGIKASSDYELNQKLLRFALSRGFTFDIIRQCLDIDNSDVDDEL
jgi:regulatory protein